ncbi:ABC-2 transporter permease [Oceanobacillus chungangensis]|uniref:ABC-2 transporter permease n=1 Tax=Oceanobacillus chungangensis TaxID=1229152 RepID=A0A3D8PHQ7_9BACI|nr:ABC-2 transporter permease [Oceanobacillus chungangensis]RDW15594.1 hypothetical protein CWR45_17630 [Oceanobacillus chungangensis]
MLQILNKEFQLSFSNIILTIIFIPIAYILNISSIFLYIGFMFGFIFYAFYYDGKNHANRFIKSLPIKLRHVVLARHLFQLGLSIIVLIYLSIIDALVHHYLPYFSYQPISWITVLILFALTSFISAVSYPIYYYFQSFTTAVAVQIGSLTILASLTGIALNLFHVQLEPFIFFILDLIEFQPTLIIILFSIGCLFLSYLLSSWIYARKETQ